MGTIARIAFVISFISVAVSPALPKNSTPTSAGLNLPFAFVENQGQTDPAVRYVGNGPEFKAWFRKDGVILQQRETAVRVTFAGPALMKNPLTVPADPLGATASYFHGNNPAEWKAGLPLYASLHYQGVWPGVDINYKAMNGRVKAEYMVARGAKPGEIELRFDGETTIEPDGALRIHGAAGDFVEDKPVLFQIVNGQRREVRELSRIWPMAQSVSKSATMTRPSRSSSTPRSSSAASSAAIRRMPSQPSRSILMAT